MRLLFRFVGLLFLAGAFAALVVDGTRSVAAGAITLQPLGEALTTLSLDGFHSFQHWVQARLPTLWDPVIVTILLMPSWIVLGIVGLVLIALTRPRRPPIGHSRR